MAVTLIEKPERSGDTSQAAGSGRWEYVARVTGEANPETALINAIISDTGFFWYNLSLKEVSFKELGNSLYTASVDWVYEVPDAAAQSPTDSPGPTDGPGGTAPSGTPIGVSSAADFFGVDVSFEVGGRPPKLTTSYNVLSGEKAGGGAAPNHGTLLHWNKDTNEVDGLEVDDPDTVMTVDRLFDRISMNDIKLWESARWKKNDATFWGRDAGELVLMGFSVPKADANGRRLVVFRFGLRPNVTIDAERLRNDAGKELPTANVSKDGWDYLEIGYENSFDATAGVTVAKPAWYRVHELFAPVDYSSLGIGGA